MYLILLNFTMAQALNMLTVAGSGAVGAVVTLVGVLLTRKGKKAELKQSSLEFDLSKRESTWGELTTTLTHQREELVSLRARVEVLEGDLTAHRKLVYEHTRWDHAAYVKLLAHHPEYEAPPSLLD